MLFYAIVKQQKEISFSLDPVVDDLLSEEIIAMGPALPLSCWQDIFPANMENGQWLQAKDHFRKKISQRLKKTGIPQEFVQLDLRKAFPPQKWLAHQAILDHQALARSFADKIRNRQLFEGQMKSLAADMGLTVSEIIVLAQQAVHLGLAEWVAAISRKGGQWRCTRCGETDLESWPGIYGISRTCPHCLALGALSSQQAVLRWTSMDTSGSGKKEMTGKKQTIPGAILPFQLTRAQEKAVQELRLIDKNMKTGQVKEALVWAACGAGKTEVVFEVIAQALAEGERVLYATPRRDVVHDTAQRSQQAFPEQDTQILSGDLPRSFRQAGLVTATTHQVYHYYQAFDLVILDEMDAFPYYGNKALEYGIRQAMKPGARIINLTATPSPEIRKKVQSGQVFLVRLPARHHRKPLPVPVLLKSKGLSMRTGSIEEQVRLELSRLRANGPVLVFVPVIDLVPKIINQLQVSFKGSKVGGSWSSDPDRQQKTQIFLKGEYDFFVSTSILERGVTLNGLQVMVLFADHPVFDERSLVQMAGRAGRTLERPEGKVIFSGLTLTKAMKEAVEWIEEQNEIARREGLVD